MMKAAARIHALSDGAWDGTVEPAGGPVGVRPGRSARAGCLRPKTIAARARRRRFRQDRNPGLRRTGETPRRR
ncbi:MAG: hypothetical protein MZV70_11945 [Desulfobacterales bacterium]|nr:hypothetical protein [Desulfobacterales bacterium]